MPRISEKARLTSDLNDLWLSLAVTTIILREDDSEDLFRHLLQSEVRPYREERGVSWKGCEGGRAGDTHFTTILNWILNGEELGDGGGEGSLMHVGGRGQRGRSLEEEVMEVVELLSLMVPAVRYLVPRDPIPRSEYLFRDHVC